MRVTAISAALALSVLTISTSVMAQRPDAQIDARSLALLADGRAAQASGNVQGANDFLESALAVDPRNREAFIVLGDIARAQSLPGKAIRLYREALLLEPNDLTALRGQGEAMVAKGALAKAKGNLSKIQALCKSACNEATVLAAAIAKGPPATPVAAAVVAPATTTAEKSAAPTVQPTPKPATP